MLPEDNALTLIQPSMYLYLVLLPVYMRERVYVSVAEEISHILFPTTK